jgi:hypothetical protein
LEHNYGSKKLKCEEPELKEEIENKINRRP